MEHLYITKIKNKILMNPSPGFPYYSNIYASAVKLNNRGTI